MTPGQQNFSFLELLPEQICLSWCHTGPHGSHMKLYTMFLNKKNSWIILARRGGINYAVEGTRSSHIFRNTSLLYISSHMRKYWTSSVTKKVPNGSGRNLLSQHKISVFSWIYDGSEFTKVSKKQFTKREIFSVGALFHDTISLRHYHANRFLVKGKI